jgi:hypothetical protein
MSTGSGDATFSVTRFEFPVEREELRKKEKGEREKRRYSIYCCEAGNPRAAIKSLEARSKRAEKHPCVRPTFGLRREERA